MTRESGDNSLKGKEILDFLESKGLDLGRIKFEKNSLEFCLKIWAKPGSKKEKLEISPQGELIVATRSKALEGQANKGIGELIAHAFGLAARQVELISGSKAKHKSFKVIYLFTDHKDVSYYRKRVAEVLDT